MRAVLLAVLVAAAFVLPALLHYRPASAPAAAPPADERPERVFAAVVGDYLPFACRATSSCCKERPDAAVLVQADAIWIGTSHGPYSWPTRIPRDGDEWEQILPALSARGYLDGYGRFQVAVDDDARYEDLLVAMMTAKRAGFLPDVVMPALPSYPNHGHGAGMGL